MKRWFLISFLCFGIVGYWIWFHRPHSADQRRSQGTPDLEFYTSIRSGCLSEIRILEMTDPYLRGLLPQGAKFQASMNYYQCHELEKMDLVLYRYSWKMPPVARQVVAVPGDRIELKKVSNGWELWINGKIHKGGQENFIFGVPEVAPPLKLYADANGGKILPSHVLILSSFPPGDRDSSVFGAVDMRDIIAKISL